MVNSLMVNNYLNQTVHRSLTPTPAAGFGNESHHVAKLAADFLRQKKPESFFWKLGSFTTPMMIPAATVDHSLRAKKTSESNTVQYSVPTEKLLPESYPRLLAGCYYVT